MAVLTMPKPDRHPLPQPGVVVRDATEADMAQVHAIYSYYVANTTVSFELVAPDLNEMRARRLAALDRGLPFLVAVEAGEVKAFAYASPFRMRAAYRFTVENSVYVGRGQTGRGLGRAVLAELVRRCTAAGFRQMVAVDRPSGQSGLSGPASGAGFHPCGRIQGDRLQVRSLDRRDHAAAQPGRRIFYRTGRLRPDPQPEIRFT